MESMHELLTAFKQHGLNIPFQRLESIMREHQLLKEHCTLVNEVAQQNGPSNISTAIVRQRKYASQP